MEHIEITANQTAPSWTLLLQRMHTLEVIVLQKTPRSSARWKGLGVVVSVAIAGVAIFALTHALKNVDYAEVFAVIKRTNPTVIALAFGLGIALPIAFAVWSRGGLRRAEAAG